MKLKSLFEDKDSNTENETLPQTPPPGKLGEFITSAQAAQKLSVTMSRIRQFVMDGTLKSYPPEKGRRDNIFKLADVLALKAKRDAERRKRRKRRKTKKNLDKIKEK